MARTKIVNIRFFDDEYFWVSDAAKASNTDTAKFIRDAALSLTNCPKAPVKVSARKAKALEQLAKAQSKLDAITGNKPVAVKTDHDELSALVQVEDAKPTKPVSDFMKGKEHLTPEELLAAVLG